MATPPAPPAPPLAWRVLERIPALLASHWHVLWLLGLGVYLIVLPLAGVHVSGQSELIGGNYTNVTSAIGGCIAAGGTVHLVKRGKVQAAQLDSLHTKVDAIAAGSPADDAGPAI
jgi:hypothetical protein